MCTKNLRTKTQMAALVSPIDHLRKKHSHLTQSFESTENTFQFLLRSQHDAHTQSRQRSAEEENALVLPVTDHDLLSQLLGSEH